MRVEHVVFRHIYIKNAVVREYDPDIVFRAYSALSFTNGPDRFEFVQLDEAVDPTAAVAFECAKGWVHRNGTLPTFREERLIAEAEAVLELRKLAKTTFARNTKLCIDRIDELTHADPFKI